MNFDTNIGVICGRWQPFHRGHQEYLLAAASRSKRLLVGITNPDSAQVFNTKACLHRSSRAANPFSYYERLLMISAAAEEMGIQDKLIGCIPFPLGNSNVLASYVPPSATIYVTIYDDWGREKLKLLQQAGWFTKVLWTRTDKERFTSGSEIRELMRRGEPWMHLVPDSVARVINHLNLMGERSPNEN